MRTVLLSLVFATLAVASAQAQTKRSTCSSNYMGGYTCTTEEMRDNTVIGWGPKISAAEKAEVEGRTAKWEAYCQPKVVQGPDGIDRYQYANPGCEFGRSGP
jgi:hypothetical protein